MTLYYIFAYTDFSPDSNLMTYSLIPQNDEQSAAFCLTILFWGLTFLAIPLGLSALAYHNAAPQDRKPPKGSARPQAPGRQQPSRISSFSELRETLSDLTDIVPLLGIALIGPMILVFLCVGQLDASNFGGGVMQGTFWVGLATVLSLVIKAKQTEKTDDDTSTTGKSSKAGRHPAPSKPSAPSDIPPIGGPVDKPVKANEPSAAEELPEANEPSVAGGPSTANKLGRADGIH